MGVDEGRRDQFDGLARQVEIIGGERRRCDEKGCDVLRPEGPFDG